MKKLSLLIIIALVVAPAMAAPVGTKLFTENFENGDVPSTGTPYDPTTHNVSQPEWANTGAAGNWLPVQYDQGSGTGGLFDTNWNMSIQGDSGTWSIYTWGGSQSADPAPKAGNEGQLSFYNLTHRGFYDRDGFGKFSDAAGNPITVTAGQTIAGQFAMFHSAGFPSFALADDIQALCDETADTNLNPAPLSWTGYPGSYGLFDPGPMAVGKAGFYDDYAARPNVVAQILFGDGNNGRYTESISAADTSDLSLGKTHTALTPDINNHVNGGGYDIVDFLYTVGSATFDVMHINGVLVQVEGGGAVPVYNSVTTEGVDGFVFSAIDARYNPAFMFIDDISFSIVPEPATLALLGLGGLLLRRRKRA